jgi:hypothetical protein
MMNHCNDRDVTEVEVDDRPALLRIAVHRGMVAKLHRLYAAPTRPPQTDEPHDPIWKPKLSCEIDDGTFR